MKKVLSFLLCAVLCVLFACTAYAASTTEATEPIDATRADCTLTVSYPAAANCGVSLEVKLHYIADLSAEFQYTLRSPYPQVELNGISTQDEWNAVSYTLGAYITADEPEPLCTVSTDADGKAIFTGLRPGLYYVEDCAFTAGRTTYRYVASL